MQEQDDLALRASLENMGGPCVPAWRYADFTDGQDAPIRLFMEQDGLLMIFSRDTVMRIDLANVRADVHAVLEPQRASELLRLKIGGAVAVSSLTNTTGQQILALIRGEMSRIEQDRQSGRRTIEIKAVGVVIAAILIGSISGFLSAKVFPPMLQFFH